MRASATILYSISTVALVGGLALWKEGSRLRSEHASHEYLERWQTTLPLGDPFPDAAVSIDGVSRPIRELLRGHWTFVVCASQLPEQGLEYPRILVDRYRPQGLRYLFVLPPGKNSRGSKRSDVAMVVDQQRQLAERLGLPQAEHIWSFVVDPGGRVRFSYPRNLSPDTSRRLAERLLLDAGAPLPVRPPVGLSRGTSAPDTPVRRVSDGYTIPLSTLAPGASSTVIFFRAHCTACGLQNIANELVTVAKAGVRFDAERIHVVFSKAFAAYDLTALKSGTAAIVSEIYTAADYIPEWEDPYVTTPGASTAAQVIQLDSRAKIVSVTEYSSWLNSKLEARKTNVEGIDSNDVDSPLVRERRLYDIQPNDSESDGDFAWLSHITAIPNSGEMFILDSGQSRVFVSNLEGTLVRRLSRIGQARGDLFQPSAMAAGPDGNLYIVDRDGTRVQILDRYGATLGSFDIHEGFTDSIAVTGSGSIVINAPRSGHLMAVYGRDGRRERYIGDLAQISKVYAGRADTSVSQIAFSRVWTIAGEDDSVYAVFQFMPLVRKYTRTGTLLWERRLDGPEVDAVARMVWAEPGAPSPRAVRNIDGIQLPYVCVAATLTPKNSLLIALSTGELLALTSKGEPRGVLRPGPTVRQMLFTGMIVAGEKLYAVTPKRWVKGVQTFAY